jgi:hypothetical protein
MNAAVEVSIFFEVFLRHPANPCGGEARLAGLTSSRPTSTCTSVFHHCQRDAHRACRAHSTGVRATYNTAFPFPAFPHPSGGARDDYLTRAFRREIPALPRELNTRDVETCSRHGRPRDCVHCRERPTVLERCVLIPVLSSIFPLIHLLPARLAWDICI